MRGLLFLYWESLPRTSPGTDKSTAYISINTMNIYVGNLAWKTRQKELKELFENFGEVTNAFIVRDKVTRRSRGFGFVEMAEEKDARQAIEKLNNTVFLDRTIIVNEALPKDDDGNARDSDNAADEWKAVAESDTESVAESDTESVAESDTESVAESDTDLDKESGADSDKEAAATATAAATASESRGDMETESEKTETAAENPADEPEPTPDEADPSEDEPTAAPTAEKEDETAEQEEKPAEDGEEPSDEPVEEEAEDTDKKD